MLKYKVKTMRMKEQKITSSYFQKSSLVFVSQYVICTIMGVCNVTTAGHNNSSKINIHNNIPRTNGSDSNTDTEWVSDAVWHNCQSVGRMDEWEDAEY